MQYGTTVKLVISQLQSKICVDAEYDCVSEQI